MLIYFRLFGDERNSRTMKVLSVLIVLFTVLYFTGALDANLEIVNTKNGPVQGATLQTIFENKAYIAFRGIPFAEPPIKSLRFKVNKILIHYFSMLDLISNF